MTKVVHIITRMILGGAQENTLLTVEGLHALGDYEVTLVTGPAIGPEGELVSEARDCGAGLVIVDEMRREIHPWRDLQTLRTLTRLLREMRPDIVHTHSSKAGILGRIAAKRAGVPIITHTIHGQAFHPNLPRWQYKLFLAAEKYCARFSTRIISVCDAMTDQAVEVGVAPREKFVTIYSGMEVERFLDDGIDRDCFRARIGLRPDQLVVGKVARLAELKGHEDLIRATAKIIDRFPNLALLFVGDGALRDQIEETARSLGLDGRIIFTGMVGWREVPDYIKAMDVLVHASLREGLSRALPQALLACVPVISFDVDGAREVIIPGQTGWLVEPRSVDGLADALADALGDLGRAMEFAWEGRRLCRRRFAADVMVKRIDQLYRQLMRGAGRE